MSKYRGSSVPEAFRQGPAPPSRVARGPLQYKAYPLDSKPWVEKVQPKGETKNIGRFSLWVRNNPRKAHHVILSLGLLVFFSRPLYDIFFRDTEKDLTSGSLKRQ